MTDLYSQLDHLPAEIWNEILQNATLEDLCNLALVCKTWLYPAQLLLYSNVTISTIPQLQKFHDAVENNIHLGTLVKTFRSSCHDIWAPEHLIDTVSSLLNKFLPNLEELQASCLHSYKPILNALINSNLNRLKLLDGSILHHKREENENYIRCALLMKNRIERLTIVGNYVDKRSCEEIPFNHLYNTLHQFVSLTSINVRIQTNEEIQVLEHIVESCKFLKEINCYFSPINFGVPSNANFSIAAIHNLTPRPNVKHLTFESDDVLDEKKYIYIMHKFTQLERFNSDTGKRGLHRRLSQDVLTQLSLFLLKVKNAQVGGIEVDGDTIGTMFQHVWNSTSTFGSEEVKIIYPYAFNSSHVRISISKSKIEKITQLEIRPEPSGESFFTFLRGIGKYLKKIDIYNEADYDQEVSFAFPENGMEHITKYCPNLKCLHFKDCYFGPSGLLSVEPNGVFSLDELSFDECFAEDDVLKHFSQLISNIKKLTIISNNFDEIIMPYTEIDSLVIDFDFYSNNYLYIKILTLCTNDHYYYRFNCENRPMTAEDSNVEEYEDADDDACFYICCQSKPSLEII